ncbi:MAG: aminotransferase class V-fold PLP-dependent enzyme [Planctomycetes bacterium]|nr:aminotransferase class V-fold PLP-dependent enzyme [Planctomycetota bacterium]MCB9909708.1 aminotransferase class V-fold PLP-dependent enzyme [Planctomycetota bacterium]MCB9911803.1 aminotransferase class V-fold PLP-dependent enzyme [Planctomycetota bacterium]HPF14067.1 aminotransferase class V-fold PLP-dependent enzyme [Planctomycetota bacterium]HRV79916.1 aminotransferase class V-fold PLP-dependent enzyme [Planctomycetota bacterium]
MSVKHDPNRWRERFPILRSSTYLVNHSLGAMPIGVYDRLKAYADQWAERGVRAWTEGWWTSAVDVGNVLGRIMNAPKDSVVMHQNVSVVQSMIASALDFGGKRNKVVYTDQNFPSNMYVWEGFRPQGARIHVVPSDAGGIVPTERLLEAIDEETLIVPISMVCFRNSYLQDVQAICQRAREVGALVLLDTYQTLGTVPVDVQALGVDMLCGGSVKWLLGGPGAGYLYMRPDLMESMHSRITGWAAHAEPFAFEEGAQRYAKGPMGWMHGTPGVPCYLAAQEGYETVLEVGVETIRAYSIQLNNRLAEQLTERGFTLFGPKRAEQRGGTLTVALADDENGPAFVRALEKRNILIDHRPGAGLRISPHFYTLQDELDELAEALSDIRQSGAWRPLVTQSAGY